MKDLPPALEELVKQLGCGNCGTARGRGLVVSVSPEEAHMYFLTAKCLRCGVTTMGRVYVRDDEPAPVDAAPRVSDISSDEAIDLHEALKSDDWLLQLTGKKP
jgi:hypothetical protein